MGRVSDAKERLMKAAQDLIWENSYGSTTVDAICEKANVKKGSFYHFFDSKSDLAVEAIDTDWAERRRRIDAIFSPTIPPLERLRSYFEHVYLKQVELKKERGRVLGCPLFTLGCEVSAQDQLIRAKVEEVLAQYTKYFETAIRDANAAGLIRAPDAASKARMLFAYFEGVLAQARIQNNPELLNEVQTGFMEILGSRRVNLAA
ncbi:MAG: TetR family transcriptional regulator [Verrucomicrobiales bacterium]|jgi:TetR/AcrR family transcriptional repressor of nem operon|nr:TetR family transcriptional regulator [Verrucomicrobiales bacterium]